MGDKIAFLFPGQGSQKEGMGNGVLETQSFRHLEELGGGIREILNGDRKTIEGEAALAVSAVSLASAGELIKAGIKPDYLAGFSLGEISALILSGMLGEKEGFDLLKLRTESMKEDCLSHRGSMYAVNGISPEKVNEVSKRFKNVWGVNYNSPLQTVISGDGDEASKASEDLKSLGAKTVKLGVSGAFHSPFMEKTSVRLKDFLKSSIIREPKYPSLSNVTGDVYPKDPEIVKDLISRQVKSPVLFTKMVERLLKYGVTVFIEVGYGKTLISLVKRTAPNPCDLTLLSVSSLEDVKNAAELLGRKNL